MVTKVLFNCDDVLSCVGSDIDGNRQRIDTNTLQLSATDATVDSNTGLIERLKQGVVANVTDLQGQLPKVVAMAEQALNASAAAITYSQKALRTSNNASTVAETAFNASTAAAVVAQTAVDFSGEASRVARLANGTANAAFFIANQALNATVEMGDSQTGYSKQLGQLQHRLDTAEKWLMGMAAVLCGGLVLLATAFACSRYKKRCAPWSGMHLHDETTGKWTTEGDAGPSRSRPPGSEFRASQPLAMPFLARSAEGEKSQQVAADDSPRGKRWPAGDWGRRGLIRATAPRELWEETRSGHGGGGGPYDVGPSTAGT